MDSSVLSNSSLCSVSMRGSRGTSGTQGKVSVGKLLSRQKNGVRLRLPRAGLVTWRAKKHSSVLRGTLQVQSVFYKPNGTSENGSNNDKEPGRSYLRQVELSNLQKLPEEPMIGDTTDVAEASELNLTRQVEGYLGGDHIDRKTSMSSHSREELTQRIYELEDRARERDLQRDRLITALQAAAEKRAKEDAFARARSQQRICELADQVSALQAERTRSEQVAAAEMSRMEKSAAADRKKYQAEMNRLQQEHSQMETQVNALQAVVRARTASLQEMRNELNQMHDRQAKAIQALEQARSVAQRLEDEKGESEAEVSRLEALLAHKDSEIATLHEFSRKQMAEHRLSVDRIKDDALKQSEISKEMEFELTNQRDEARRHVGELTAQVECLEQRLEQALQQALETGDLAAQGMELTKQLEAELETVKAEKAEQAVVLAQTELNRDSLESSLALKTSALDQLQDSINSQRASWEKAKKHLETQRDESRAQVESLKHELEVQAMELKQTQEEARVEVQAAMDMVERTKKQIERVTERAQAEVQSAEAIRERCAEERAFLDESMEQVQAAALGSIAKAVDSKHEMISEAYAQISEVSEVVETYRELMTKMAGGGMVDNPAQALRDMRHAADDAAAEMNKLSDHLKNFAQEAEQESSSGRALEPVHVRVEEQKHYKALSNRNEDLELQVHELKTALNHVHSMLEESISGGSDNV